MGQAVVLNIPLGESHESPIWEPGVAELIAAAGASVVYLPPYSPDLNPIEMMWSKVKAHLRKAKARTRQALDDAIAAALGLVSQADISGWYAKDGYGIQ